MGCRAASFLGWTLAVLLFGTGCDTLPRRGGAMSAPSLANAPAANAATFDPSILKASADMKPSSGGSARLHLDLARALDSQGQLEKANQEYQQAIEASRKPGALKNGTPEERARLHRHLARAYERMAQFGEAEAHHKAAQKLAPNDADVWNDSGYGAYLRQDWASAERDFRKALALSPGHTRAATNLGLALVASGRAEEGYEALRTAGGEAAAHANVAYVLAAQGKSDDAKRHYETAKTLDPKMQIATRGSARLQNDPATDSTLAAK